VFKIPWDIGIILKIPWDIVIIVATETSLTKVWTDRQTDGRTRWLQYSPLSTSGGIITYTTPKTLNYLAFHSFDFECIWWRLFQKCIVRTKFDIYVVILLIQFHVVHCQNNWNLHEWREIKLCYCTFQSYHYTSTYIGFGLVMFSVGIIALSFRKFQFSAYYHIMPCINETEYVILKYYYIDIRVARIWYRFICMVK
jgi:hypothetical protein